MHEISCNGGARGHHRGLDDIEPAAGFNERDDARRTEAIARTYTAHVTWTDDEGVITGHTALQAKAKELLSRIRGFVFSPAGPVYRTLGLGYLAFNLGPDGAAPVISGFDVAIVRDGLIAELYTVITKAPQSPAL